MLMYTQFSYIFLFKEYDRWQQKVDKLKKKERSGPNIVKLDSVSDQSKKKTVFAPAYIYDVHVALACMSWKVELCLIACDL